MQIITPRDIGIAEWRPFYTTVAEVAATLAGLMFVALTLHAQALKGPAKANLRRVAEHTFTDFFLAILTGLLLILPGPYLGFGAIVLLALALGSLLRLVPEFLRMSFSAESTAAEHRGYAFKRLSISLLGRLFLAAGAVALLLPAARFISMDSAFLTATVVLLVNAVRNAWFLLVHELPGH